ncbi:MAG TPA: hypothetical protein PK335_04725 [Draconibacterium sp.]|nr:hypothetical protein [Draconibacterium sp.]
MKILLSIFIVTISFLSVFAQNSLPDFKWSNSYYYNLTIGDSIEFNQTTISLLGIDHQYSQLKVDNEKINVRVSRRSIPVSVNGIQLFVADNRNVADLTPGDVAHGLLTGDALICITGISDNWLSSGDFIFPVSFNHGFLWNADNDTYLFSLMKDTAQNSLWSYPGIGIDMHDARGLEKHWLLAIEESKVEWIEENDKNSVCVCLSSKSSPGIYYIYDKLFSKTLDVRRGQELEKGDLIGTAWGDQQWGYALLSVIYSDSLPEFTSRFSNCVNFYPQFFGLYYRETFNLSNYFTKGRIEFGRTYSTTHLTANASAREEYLGKGWEPCTWNTAEKLDWFSIGKEGNVRIRKTLFAGTAAQVTNPNDFCEYEINVRNGIYRISAKVGDVKQKSWQKIEFEGINAGTFELEPGIQKWTSERVVKVEDTKLTIRIYFDNASNTIAGLSELVFQQAY